MREVIPALYHGEASYGTAGLSALGFGLTVRSSGQQTSKRARNFVTSSSSRSIYSPARLAPKSVVSDLISAVALPI